MSTHRFNKQVVLITGASSGIGAALSKAFAAEGADLLLGARRVDRLASVAKACREEAGRKVVYQACDVTREGDLKTLVVLGKEKFKRLDVVVANAGFIVKGLVEDLGVEDFRRQMEINLYGVLRTIYATLSELKESKGRLVIIGSINCYASYQRMAPYSMSKFALRALADSLYHELRPSGVSVTLICPGLVESEIRQVDKYGDFRPREGDSTPSWLVMPAEKAARAIVNATYYRSRETIVTLHGKAVVTIIRHFPSIFHWLISFAKFLNKERPEKLKALSHQ